MTDQGTLIGGRYELGDLLGRGGMADVRKGVDVRLGRVVAIKRLRTDLVGDSTFQARFRREAQAAAALNHPAIASVYDTGEEVTHTPSGTVVQPYIVMEYVPGRTLRDILREGRKILPERALEIVSGVLSALEYSHQHGIVHRDIKPANVMLTPSGDVKVMDFGIARAVADASGQMTQTSAVVGTAQYLSPEQARGEVVDARSDIYSAGCLLYELLTLRPPFSGESPVSLVYQHVREQAPVPSAVDSSLPTALDAIVMKALEKDPGDRYQSAAEMRADIARYLAGQQVSAPAPTILTRRAGDDATSVIRPSSRRAASRRRNVWPYVALGAAVVVLLVGAAFAGAKLFSSGTQTVAVPRLLNLDEAGARAELEKVGLELGKPELVASSEIAAGLVVSQTPDPLVEVKKGSTVSVKISSGIAKATIPPLEGQLLADAQAALKALNFDDVVPTGIDSDQPANTVISVDPPAGTEVPLTQRITITFSNGPIPVPDVKGQSEAAATATLTNAGFQVKAVYDTVTQAQYGTVLDQTPAASEQRKRGDTIVITVSHYQAPTDTQTPTGTPSGTPTP